MSAHALSEFGYLLLFSLVCLSLLVLPLYQIMLLIYGAIFGQFRFFWEKEKQLVKRIGGIFIRKK